MRASVVSKLKYGLAISLALFTSSSPGADSVFPGQNWEETTPESQGLDGAKIGIAVKYLEADGKRLWPGAPSGTFAAAGHNNNRLFVIPEGNMVVARLGLDEGERKMTDETFGEFLRRTGEAITEGATNRPGTKSL